MAGVTGVVNGVVVVGEAAGKGFVVGGNVVDGFTGSAGRVGWESMVVFAGSVTGLLAL
jgi:hypothetical protein